VSKRTIAESHKWRIEESDAPKGTTLYVPWRLSRCAKCEALMIPRGLKIDDWGSALWGRAAKEMGLVRRFDGRMDEDMIVCAPCARKGGATFTCALCGVARGFDQEHDSWGDPAERLCVPCYETVPAKVWEAKTKELYGVHRYDFE
jgi:hypothetical protein